MQSKNIQKSKSINKCKIKEQVRFVDRMGMPKLFRGIQTPIKIYGVLNRAIKKTLEKKSFTAGDSWLI